MTTKNLAQRLRQATGTLISHYTARNRLRAARLTARRPYKGVLLTVRHRAAREKWARQHSCWTRQRWKRVVFTDESKFNLRGADGRVRVWRRRGERMDPANVIEYDHYGGGSVLIWGGMSILGRQN